MSFPRYPKYKDSGVEWLGEVPEHWEVKPLKHVADFINGAAFKPTEWSEQGTPIIRIQNLNGGEDFNFFNGRVEKQYWVNHGDLLFGWSGNRGTSFGPFLWRHPELCFLNQHIFRVVPRAAEKRELYWVLKAVTGHVEDQAHGIIGMVHVTKGNLGAIKVPIPSSDEQTLIASFLDSETAKIDELVAEQRRLMELLKEKRQAVISHAVTRGLDPHALLKPSGIEWLGDVPAHWSIERGRFLYKKQEIPPEPEDDVVTAFRDGQVTLRKNRRTEGFTMAVLEVGYQRVQAGDLVIHGMDAFAGAIGVSESTGKCTPEYSVMTPSRPGVDNRYYAMILRLMAQRNYVFVICPSVRERAPRFRFEAFKDVHLPVPPFEEQREIMNIIEAVSAETVALTAEAQRAIDLLQERRAALISAAVTGQIDVRVSGVEAGTEKPYSSGFARQLLAAEILSHCHDHPTTGRVKLQKLIHLCEHVAEIDEIGASYARKAAGPFDHKVMFGIASGLSKQRWFEEVKDGQRSSYRPLEKAGEHEKYLERWRDRMPNILKVLSLLGKAETQQCEIVSTLYAAWNDLLIEGRSPTDAEIIHEASDPVRWHENKAKIPPGKWPSALQWMRGKGICPNGFGSHTTRKEDLP